VPEVSPEIGLHIIKTVTELTRDYIKNPKSIIVATIPCKEEEENQSIIEIVREIDPDKNRTVFVLTKPDTIEPGTHKRWTRKLDEDINSLRPKYFVVMNPNQMKLNNKVTFDQARKDEDRVSYKLEINLLMGKGNIFQLFFNFYCHNIVV
jgi:hypothetical protein